MNSLVDTDTIYIDNLRCEKSIEISIFDDVFAKESSMYI